MKMLIRWGKFNLVGAMGMVVQLTALALFTRWSDGHYLLASAVAVELTLMHNFVWHLRYTWRDRRDGSTRLAQFVRFHLSNGMISLVGNLLLMRMLVDKARVPVLAANVIAILCCSIANFCLGNNWTFAGVRKAESYESTRFSDRDFEEAAVKRALSNAAADTIVLASSEN